MDFLFCFWPRTCNTSISVHGITGTHLSLITGWWWPRGNDERSTAQKILKKLLKGIPRFQRKLSSKTSNVLRILPKISRLYNNQSSTNIPKLRLPLCRGRRAIGKEYYTATTLFSYCLNMNLYHLHYSYPFFLFLSVLSRVDRDREMVFADIQARQCLDNKNSIL